MDPFENNKLELEGLPQLGDQDFEMLPKRYFRLRMWTWGATSLISILLRNSVVVGKSSYLPAPLQFKIFIVHPT